MKTNEQAKQEAIKKAYGEHMDIVKDRLYGSWCMLRLNETPGTFGFKDSEVQRTSSGAFRPNMLIGINDNNGWIRIEPDGSNLPNKDIQYECFKEITDSVHWQKIVLKTELFSLFYSGEITHYKVYNRQKPIY